MARYGAHQLPRQAALASLLVLTALCGCERVAARYCDVRLPPARLSVVTLPIAPTPEHRFSARQLDALEAHSSAEITMGLTTARPKSEVQFQLHGMRVPGGVCVRPDLDVTLGYTAMHVDIATDLAPQSCLYKTVLAHEMRHVQAYRDYLAVAQSSLAAHLAEELPAPRIYRFGSMPEATDYFTQLQDTRISQLAEEALDGVTALQAGIDTPEEYRRISTACRTEAGDAIPAP